MSVVLEEWLLQMKMILNYPQAKQMIMVINYEVKCSSSCVFDFFILIFRK